MKSKVKVYAAVTDNEELVILNSVSEKGCFDETTLDNRHDCMNEFIWDIKDTDKPVETGVYLLTVEFEFSATEHFDYIVTDCECLLSTVC